MNPRATMSTAVPLTPKKSKEDNINLKISAIVSSLSHEWDLQFELPKPGDSPSNRQNQTLAQRCVFTIKGLTFKNAIDSVLEDFYSQANIMYSRWVHKPKGDRGTVPEKTRHRPHPVSDKERFELQTFFYKIASREFRPIITKESETPLSKRHSLRPHNRDDISLDRSPPPSRERPVLDDTPIPSKLLFGTRKPSLKRAAETAYDEAMVFKRPPKPDSRSELGPDPRRSFSMTTTEGRMRKPSHDASTIMSVNTSSNSFAHSVFDTSFDISRGQSDAFSTTQITEADDDDLEHQTNRSIKLSLIDDHQSSEYEGGSSFDARLSDVVKLERSFQSANNESQHESDVTEADDEIFEDAVDNLLENDDPKIIAREQKLRDSLKNVFPIMPHCLLSTPLHVRYEITRVFIHAGVSLEGLAIPNNQRWEDYDSLWAFLRGQAVLKGRPFPERTSKQVWAACQDNFRYGPRGVAMTGSLRYLNTTSTEPLFQFQLEPLRLEKTYRLRRRFGNDRFLELDIPKLTGRRVPKVLRGCPNGKSIIAEWLFHDMHPVFGRFWVPFCTRPKEGKERKTENDEQQSEVDNGVAHRMYFFAVHGTGFADNNGTPKESETVETHSAMSVDALLNWIRPTWENRDQSYLKLFARTQLALSRNTPTVVLSRTQIRYRRDLTCNNEVMTDGAGRLSSALALRIVHMLGLSHLPSGFQGRIGDAKGFWSIDHQYHGPDEWIEIYDSQRKWKRSGETLDDSDFKDPTHRTFEVNKWSTKLKPADFNPQLLPILMDRAKSKPKMRITIEQLLKEDLTTRIESQRSAMENPLSFRKWVRDSNPRIADRVKQREVPFLGAVPDPTEEKMNMFLDAGFDPLKLKYLNELAQMYYTQKCNELRKQLHITVPRSTYAFMVPDFAGVLEEDEIYIHISESFVDELSPLSGCPLQGIDVLVARSPAHYASDIQRVKAVVKEGLMGLKDVVVFPTKGNPSLADKLSGGDYDGDIAWICWEPLIVENFRNAPVPRIPDLIKDGFILKDRTTYEELVKGEPDPTTTFLKRSFEFNLESSMLGICTVFKEKVCYTQGQINSKEAVALSTLLSNLVDHAKQGYTFTEVQWKHFCDTLIKITPRQPLYKSGDLDPKAKHIIDRVMFVTDSTIKEILTNFHKSTTKAEYWDPDLPAYYEWAQKEAVLHPEWREVLDKLREDILEVEAEWRQLVGSDGPKSDLPFPSCVSKCYERFVAIQPHVHTALTRSLLEMWHESPESSRWAHLRASCAFAMSHKTYVRGFVWWMAGLQLCHLKAIMTGRVVSVTPSMHAMLKPDNTYVNRILSEEAVYQLEDENSGEVEDPRWC